VKGTFLEDVLGTLIWTLRYKATSGLCFPLSTCIEKSAASSSYDLFSNAVEVQQKENDKKNVFFFFLSNPQSLVGREDGPKITFEDERHTSCTTYIGNGVPSFTDFRPTKNLTVICIIYIYIFLFSCVSCTTCGEL
jgi:hypothetical protein